MNKKEAARERAGIRREQSMEYEAFRHPHEKPQPKFGKVQNDLSVILVVDSIPERKPSRLQRILHRKK